MILLYGCLSDPPLVRTLEAVQAEGAPYVLLAQSALDRERLVLDVGPRGVGGTLVSSGQHLPLEGFHSIYARPLQVPLSSFTPAGRAHAELLHNQIFEWLDVTEALVVNRPRAMESNASKPLQAQLIAAEGFEVPETLVTSDEDEARAFWKSHGRVVFKSTSGVRSIVQELSASNAGRLHRLSALPVQFQAYVPGIDVRVHVVGDQVFATEIESAATDYRYADRDGASVEFRAVDVPDAFAGRCVDLARRLGLALAGIDLRRRPDGGYVCFEVNPMPAYSYFESQAGLPISRALAALLVRGEYHTEVQMTQAVDNLTTIRGTIVSRRPHGSLPDYDVVTMKLEQAESVAGKAELLGQFVGKELAVTVLRALLKDAKPQQKLRCRAKRTPDGAMCEKDPAPGDFEIR